MLTKRPYYFPNWNDEDVRCYLHFMSQTSPPEDKRIRADERVIHATADAVSVSCIASSFRLCLVRIIKNKYVWFDGQVLTI